MVSIFSCPARLIVTLAACAVLTPTMAQSSCSSDGQRAPVEILERFINADCASCWADPKAQRPAMKGLAIDWIVPSAAGDDAPLSAAASQDSLQRLESLGLAPPASNLTDPAPNFRTKRLPGARDVKLRVARGIALGGYMGASIELILPLKAPSGRPPFQYPLTAWLVMAQEIRAGEDGSPVERLLVRNALVLTWNSGQRSFESRPMSLPAGSNPGKMRVVGWVVDSRGQLVASASSQCR